MKFAIAFACLLAVAAANLSDESFIRREFRLFENEHNKKYANSAERETRFQIFKTNLEQIQKHNLEGRTWTEKVSRYADLTAEEFRTNILNGYVNTYKPTLPENPNKVKVDTTQLPAAVDWRDLGAITAVKDQGSCGSCWAFAAVEMLESYAFIESGELIELSAQQLTSCTPNSLECGGTGGCAGSIPQLSFGYTQLFGIVTEAEMPYVSGDFGQTGDCEWDAETMDASVFTRGYEILPRNDLDAVMNHVATVGPLSVAVDASRWSFYGGGVFDGCDTEVNVVINHAVQLVGYGTDDTTGENFWLIRNSWGAGWGEDGYIKLMRNDVAQCGTDSTPLSGTACVNDDQTTQFVCGTCAVLFDTSYPIGTYAV